MTVPGNDLLLEIDPNMLTTVCDEGITYLVEAVLVLLNYRHITEFMLLLKSYCHALVLMML